MNAIKRADVMWAKDHDWYRDAFPNSPECGWQVQVATKEPTFDTTTGAVVGYAEVTEYFTDIRKLRRWAGY